jgi:hypothetical protein
MSKVYEVQSFENGKWVHCDSFDTKKEALQQIEDYQKEDQENNKLFKYKIEEIY